MKRKIHTASEIVHSVETACLWVWKEIYVWEDGSITKQTVSCLGIKIRTSEDRSILKKPRVAQKDDYACEKRYTIFPSDFFSFIIRYEFQSFCDASSCLVLSISTALYPDYRSSLSLSNRYSWVPTKDFHFLKQNSLSPSISLFSNFELCFQAWLCQVKPASAFARN